MGVYTGLQVEDDSGAVFHKDKLGNYWADYRIRYPHALPATRRTWDTPYTTYGDAISSDPYPLRFRLDPSPPVAIAGPDQTVDQNTAVYLDGSRSSDDRRIVEYFWNFTYDGTLRSLKGEFTSFTFADAGVYTVTLTVLDAWGNRGEDTMRVTVRDITPPLANAGSDLTIDMNEEFELTADGSLDNVGIVSWKWYIRGEDLDEEFEEWKLTYSISNPGTYTAEVVLYDAAGNKGSDTITIEVIDIIPPNAVAGPDRTVDQGTLVTFNGSASTDNVGIDRFSWVFQYDGAEVSLQEMVSPFLFEMPGTYEVTLYCHDVYDLSDADVMILTVVDTEPPVASGHTDMTVDQGTTTQLVDGGSTDNVGITRYKWTFHYAGGDVTLEGQSTTFTFDEVGEYEVTLRVEDVEGNADQVRFTISVLDTESPVADAGGNMTVDQGVLVTFNANGSTDNVGIVSYSWMIEDAYGTDTWQLEGTSPTLTFTSRGTYFATLEVEDATGNSGQAIITISVRDAIPPKAVAGEDRTVFVETLVTLDGNGSSDDVGVINWTWSYYLNGQQVVRYGRTTAVVFHETGTIVVKLKVRDAAGNEDETTFFMTVEEPPDEPTDDDGPSGLTASILVIIAVVVSVVVALRVLARRR